MMQAPWPTSGGSERVGIAPRTYYTFRLAPRDDLYYRLGGWLEEDEAVAAG